MCSEIDCHVMMFTTYVVLIALLGVIYCGRTDVKGIICPDRRGTCPNGSTCCLKDTGDYGCCPLRHAVCCSDLLHCCPEGTICNLIEQSCDVSTSAAFGLARKNLNYEFSDYEHWSKTFILPRKLRNSSPLLNNKSSGLKNSVSATFPFEISNQEVVCSDSLHQCGVSSTCCQSLSGQWGCCPIPQAVCCTDGNHCCPQQSHCNITTGMCDLNIIG